MKAVLADLSTPRYLWTAAAGKVKSDAGWGPGGLMRLADVPTDFVQLLDPSQGVVKAIVEV